MDLLEQTALLEDLEVTANGHVRHAEFSDEIGDADRSDFANAIEDERLALPGEHQSRVPSASPRLTMNTASRLMVPCKIAARRCESQRIRTFTNEEHGNALTSRDCVRTICVILSDFVGQFRRRSTRHG